MMRRGFIIVFCCMLLSTYGIGQINNGSFENWQSGAPTNWSTTNSLTDISLPIQGVSLNLTLVQESNQSQQGMSSAKMTIGQTPNIPQVGGSFTVPGAVTNGEFVSIGLSNAQSILTDLQSGNISNLVNGGEELSSRPAQLNGYYTFTSSSDSFLVFVRFTTNNQDVIVNETYQLSGKSSSFKKFSLDLNYQSCQTPDSMLIAVAAASSGNSSTSDSLRIDSLNFSGSIPSLQAVNDVDTTNTNQQLTIPVTSNDKKCGDNNPSVNIIDGPSNGNANTSNNDITYNPASDFSGMDTIVYEICTGNNPVECDTGQSYVMVQEEDVSVQDLKQGKMNVNLYPIPAYGDEVTLSVNRQLVGTKVKIFNLFGKELTEKKIASSKTTIDISDFRQGIYLYHITDQNGQMIMRNRFNIVR